MFAAQMSPGGGGDIRSAISVMRQKLGKPAQGGVGPQGIDPSQITTQGGQQGIIGRGGNFQALGNAAQTRLGSQAAAPMAGPSMDTPEVQAFMQQNPGLTPDFIRNAMQTVGYQAPSMPPPNFADRVGRAARPLGGDPGFSGGTNPQIDAHLQRLQAGAGAAPQLPTPQLRSFATESGGGAPQIDPGMANAAGTALAGAGGQTAPGMPPALAQRLRALQGRQGVNPYRSLVGPAIAGMQGGGAMGG